MAHFCECALSTLTGFVTAAVEDALKGLVVGANLEDTLT